MKKLLFILLLVLISINSYSQKITRFTFGYDEDNELICNVQVTNSSYNKTIVCVIVELQFSKLIWSNDLQQPIYPLVSYKLSGANIPPRDKRDCDFYPDQRYGKPTKITLKKVIYNDTTYQEF